jgi:hypothetical protein
LRVAAEDLGAGQGGVGVSNATTVPASVAVRRVCRTCCFTVLSRYTAGEVCGPCELRAFWTPIDARLEQDEREDPPPPQPRKQRTPRAPRPIGPPIRSIWWDRCTECGRNDLKHHGGGLCSVCARRRWTRTPAGQASTQATDRRRALKRREP